MALKAKSPGVKRILQEAKDLTDSPDYIAAPLEDNVFEWYALPCHHPAKGHRHFTLRGPPGTDFEGGRFHGRSKVDRIAFFFC